MTLVRACLMVIASLLLVGGLAAQKPAAATPAQTHTLTVTVTGMDTSGGNLGVLIFNSSKGWPDNRELCFKRIVVPATAGKMTVKAEGLPPGTYALAVGHDSNVNHKVDKNWIGKPTEQWGMSNNPHAVLKAPSFDTAKIELKSDMEVTIEMQK